jgi:hypothetical protein
MYAIAQIGRNRLGLECQLQLLGSLSARIDLVGGIG